MLKACAKVSLTNQRESAISELANNGQEEKVTIGYNILPHLYLTLNSNRLIIGIIRLIDGVNRLRHGVNRLNQRILH